MMRTLTVASKMLIAVAMAAGLSLVLLGCGDEREVGAECQYHSDCNERCVTGGDFPDGMCTVSCDDPYDCPAGTTCISKKDGVCALQCDRDRDCPGGYECDSKNERGESGNARVCIGS